ncbi:dTDP-4-dehydrorhamnose 3,5-epimerase [Ramlibacter tataouinensis]|uniref:dTDP-4-dehydrorhamnose 3,5-epimerase n=1 Tax=Ramlibacter tataouinensis TaxID=94132 RepID=UPI0022F3CC86|nr:dTDP-4-dehydrorhamnose 3,5-epimerase [Ramlibacter tataouinensis]WBY03342.1 dTDP-4-dehydrorhamnose 3,5-epimerase [Ramlibacter tataouinensis]
MQVTPTRLPEVLLIEPRVFGDARGFFLESWNQRTFDQAVGQPVAFVQDNHSRSAQGVLRGIHYQLGQPQGKLVRVASGRVFDVAVDLRRHSPRCGQWVGVELSADNHRQLWIPPGFGHGFLVLSQEADVLYKTSDYHAPQDDRALAWNDPHLGIEWPLAQAGGKPLLSARDQAAPGWGEAQLYPW